MEQINLYSKKKVFIKIFLIISIFFLIAILITEDWNKPKWISLFSASTNVFLFYILTTRTYQKTRIELHRNHLIYRLNNQKQDSIIDINNKTKITQDWKGIYFTTDNSSQFISTNDISKKQTNKIFNRIRQFYNT